MKTDVCAGDGSSDKVDEKLKEWLLSRRGLLNYMGTPAAGESMLRQLTPLLVGIANIVQSSTSTQARGKIRKVQCSSPKCP